MGMLFRTALAGWWNDRAMSLGAAIAFFTVFSLAPMLLVAIAVAGLAFGREAAQGAIVDELGGLIGGQTGAALEGMIASASRCHRAGRDGKGSTRVGRAALICCPVINFRPGAASAPLTSRRARRRS